MCLRLIGLAYDRYDGNKTDEEIRKDQKERALKDSPSLLEVFGFSYSFMGLSVGPQYPMSLYRKLVDGELTEEKGQRPKCIQKTIAVALTGVGLMGLNEVLKVTKVFEILILTILRCTFQCLIWTPKPSLPNGRIGRKWGTFPSPEWPICTRYHERKIERESDF